MPQSKTMTTATKIGMTFKFENMNGKWQWIVTKISGKSVWVSNSEKDTWSMRISIKRFNNAVENYLIDAL